jgi:hypothetical protein
MHRPSDDGLLFVAKLISSQISGQTHHVPPLCQCDVRHLRTLKLESIQLSIAHKV